MNKLKQTPLPIPPHTRMQVLRNTCDTRACSREMDSTNKQNAPTRVHIYTHTRAHINVYAYMYTDIHIYIYIHIHMLYIHTCTHIYIRMHMHTYVQIENPSNNTYVQIGNPSNKKLDYFLWSSKSNINPSR